jgi:hypothetical protein
MQQSPDTLQAPNATLMEAQQSALAMTSRLGELALNYAFELNRTWFELAQNHIRQYATFPQRLAQCRTAEDVLATQADMIGKATEEFKERLSAQSGMMGKVTQNYKEGFDHLADIGEKMIQETKRAMDEGQEAVQAAAGQTVRALDEGRQAAQQKTQTGTRREERSEEKAQRPSH